jgi:hypothetical protein
MSRSTAASWTRDARDAAILRLLAHARGHLGAMLKPTITHPGASSELIDTPAEILR